MKFRFIIITLLLLMLVNTVYSNEVSKYSSENGIKLTLSAGMQAVGLKTVTASFSFLAPVLSLESQINPKFKISTNYSSGSDKVNVGNSNYNLKWREFNISADYKLLNEDKSLWASLLYKQFELNSSWNQQEDKDTWGGIGIGICYNTKIRENLKGLVSLNYFPNLSSGIGDYKNLEIKGQVEYEMKNNKNSIILYYNNQNLTSISNNISDMSINQVGIKFKMKLN